MMYLFVRAVPWLSAAAAMLAVQWQWQNPSMYPYPMLGAIGVYIAASVLIGAGRLAWKELMVKSTPSLLLLVAAALAMLVIESPESKIALTILFAGTPLLTLELLFLLAVDPVRYPVHGLSRLNVALVPITTFLLAAALSGLRIYLQFDNLSIIAIFSLFGAAVFALTSHHASSHEQDRRWAAVGALVGFHAGFLVQVLPIGLPAQGLIASLILAIPLRMRRYAFQPVPARNVAIAESTGVAVMLAAVLLLSRWA